MGVVQALPEPAEAVETVRYRAVMQLAYAVALLHLLEYARESREVFEYGPMSLAALEDQGLTISGPRLDGARKVLAEIPGLYLSDE
jgi:hypothetical protein